MIRSGKAGDVADSLLGLQNIVGRDLPRCHDKEQWTNTILEGLGSLPAVGATEKEMHGRLIEVIDKADATAGVIAGCIPPDVHMDGAKPILWVECPIFALLLIFLALEVYSEQRQLVFQALLFQCTGNSLPAACEAG